MPWKMSSKTSSGSSYRFFKQMKKAECGPAAVATAAFHIHNVVPRITDVSEYFKGGESVDRVTREGIRDFANVGSWSDGVIAALKKLKIEGVPRKNNKYFANHLLKVSKSQPAIVSVGWYQELSNTTRLKRQSGHWIVALVATKDSVICLDPDLEIPRKCGVKEIRKPLLVEAQKYGMYPKYKLDYGDGEVTGYIDMVITCKEAEHELPMFQSA